MLHKLFRKYNQNRKTIWTIIIGIAFFVILLHTVFNLMRASRDREQERLLNYNQSQNNVSNNISTGNNLDNSLVQAPEQITTSSSSKDVINYFVKLCNDKKIQEAYDMISADCKTVIFPTINDFKNNYYNKIFTQEKGVKIEDSMYGGDIYKITYSNNLLANGGYNQESTKQDYIYIVKENEQMKVSLNKFLYIQNINKTATNGNITIKVANKKVYIDHEEYRIQILNNTAQQIYITPDSTKVYSIDEKNIKHGSNIDGLQSGSTLLEPNKNIEVNLTFNKVYRFRQQNNCNCFFRSYYKL